MSWHFLQGSGEESWEANSSAGAPSALLNLLPTPVQSSSPVSETESLIPSQSGMTLRPLTGQPGAATLTSSPAASPARTSALLENGPGSTVNDPAFGASLPGSLARFDLVSYSWRTPLHSLFEDSEEFLATWPRWGSMQNGVCWARTMPELHTSEKGSGYWPTPVASDTGLRRKKYAQGGTPLSLAVQLYPTPTACPGRASITLNDWGGTGARKAMKKRVPKEELFGALNPEWVAWLMGFPSGWTSLEAMAMPSFLRWCRWHSTRLEVA